MNESPPRNPFAAGRIRPGALPYLFPPGETLDALLARLEAQQGWGEIVGPHGSGKSTLLAMLAAALEQRAAQVTAIELHDGQRDLPSDALRQATAPGAYLFVDGYEQLGWLARRRLLRWCRRHGMGLVVTTHKSQGLPRLFETATSVELALQIADRLDAGRAASIGDAEIAESFARHQGNLREVLFDLYDRYEQQHGA